MARTKADLNSGTRLADYLAASLLARVFPATQVNLALDAHDANSKRIRRFPAVAGAYFTIALSLYPDCSYEAVFSAVAQGLAWAAGAQTPQPVSKSSISELRSRIGADPLRDLMRTCCLPLSDTTRQPEAFYRGLRVVAMDGTRMEMPDEPELEAHFGRPGSRTGQAGYPQAQGVILVECASHAILSAEIGPYHGDEWELSKYLLGALEPGMLCLADRGYNGTEHWQQALASGAQLLWRASDGRHLPVLRMLDDGSYLSQIEASAPVRRRRAQADQNAPTTKTMVRVIEYQLPGAANAQPRYRLMTSLLDDQQAPALELAALYHQRWQVESVFDELKTHLRMGRRTLRSKTPELVRQEFYGLVLAHYAVRWLLHEGASQSAQPAQELSFTGHIHLLKREQPRSGAFPPTAAKTATAVVGAGARRQRQAAVQPHPGPQ
jgi:Transposase DDE domain/Insertion element 4 transposase N-terminal